MTPFSQLPPQQIKDTPAIELGSGGFCFVVADLFRLMYPDAQLFRLTNTSRTAYKHVFVKVADKPLDIKGFRPVSQMRFDFNDYESIEELADPEKMREFFCTQYSPSQMLAAISTITAYIDAHHLDFCQA